MLRRHLALRARLEAAGAINHDHLFFQKSDEPLRNPQHPGRRWRETLSTLKLRYRRPHTARHSSVSWNLMIGKNPLWVAKQREHSIATMLRVYAAWAEGSVESDVEAIRRSMNRHARLRRVAKCGTSVAGPQRCLRPPRPVARCTYHAKTSAAAGNLAVDLPVQRDAKRQAAEMKRIYLAGERDPYRECTAVYLQGIFPVP